MKKQKSVTDTVASLKKRASSRRDGSECIVHEEELISDSSIVVEESSGVGVNRVASEIRIDIPNNNSKEEDERSPDTAAQESIGS